MSEDTGILLKEINGSKTYSSSDGDHDSGRNAKATYKCTVSLALVVLLMMVFLLATAFTGGVLLAYVLFEDTNCGGSSDSTANYGAFVQTDSGETIPVGEMLSKSIVPENIKENLRFLTLKPHIAGKERNNELAHDIYEQWKDYGFDSVDMSNYTVLLDYVNRSNYNVLTIQNSNGDNLYVANTTVEKPLIKEEDYPDVPPPFNAYSGVGQAKGPLVYVNYGRLEDFAHITRNLSLNLTGYICIARYGHIYRGNKAQLAQAFGCSGLVLYSDPVDYAPRGGPSVFPAGPSLPATGIQRGSLKSQNGDPLTPGLPSIDDIHRITYRSVMEDGTVPSIPVQPISYGDAEIFMSQLTEHEVPIQWRGELDIAYHIMQATDNTNNTYIEVNNVREQAIVNNVIAFLYGSTEPDHLVILGNHHDAWTFGAIDPNSGTATLMELARVFGDMKRKGWRPGRTIVLCSWDAEEYGLIGSTEWVEHYQKLLGAKTIAYLNTDSEVSGTRLIKVTGSPLLFNAMHNSMKQISSPDKRYSTLYDQWKSQYPYLDKPKMETLRLNSDFVPFMQLLGIPCSDFAFYSEDEYPVYHSVHDNFYWSNAFTDYAYHKAIGELWSRVALELATTPLIPYDPTDYAQELIEIFNETMKSHEFTLKKHNISVDLLSKNILKFSNAASNLKVSLQTHKFTKNLNMLRTLNEKFMNLERAFILPNGLPQQPYLKHVIMASSSVNAYAGKSFPGVANAIFKASTTQDWDEVHRQLDIVAVHVMYATQIMEQPDLEFLTI